MPPKTKITRDMVAQAALDAARQGGLDAVSARTVAARLGCSTQPVLYQFATVEELRRETYRRADASTPLICWQAWRRAGSRCWSWGCATSALPRRRSPCFASSFRRTPLPGAAWRS